MIPAIAATILALVTIPVTIVESALQREDKADLAESWGFLKVLFSSLFALLLGQALAPRGLLWWVNVLVAILVTLAMVFATQLLAKVLSHGKVGKALIGALEPLIKRVNLAFTPLSGPKMVQDEFEQELIESVDDFTETIAREIMVPRIDMATIASDATLAKAMTLFLRTGYSRLPVTGKSIDDIVGVLYVKDVSRISFENPQRLTETVTKSMRKAIFIPESKPVDDLLQEMQLSSTHIALIIDEYGGVAGLVTMEDVIEELVGEISDEYDREVSDVEKLEDGKFLVNARYSLFELGELFDLELEDEDVDSVGGLVAKALGRLAKHGEVVTVSGLRFTVNRVEPRRKRLVSVLVERTSELADAESVFDSKENNEL